MNIINSSFLSFPHRVHHCAAFIVPKFCIGVDSDAEDVCGYPIYAVSHGVVQLIVRIQDII